MIAIRDEQLHITFDRWGMDEYALFLKTKKLPESRIRYDARANAYTVTAPARFAGLFGVDAGSGGAGWLDFPGYLHDYQRWIVRDLALPARRFAVWADTGLGKTAIILEWARQVAHKTGGRVLMVMPLNIIPQTLEEAGRWYGGALDIRVLPTQGALLEWCRSGAGIAAVNYEKFIPPTREANCLPDISRCAGVVLDESSRLKTGGGVIKWSLVHSCKGVEYKLSCTATPAPNDVMEYASQAAWLETIRGEGEVLWSYFKKQADGSWKLLKHAEDAFFRFMSGWSIYLRSPAAYGFRDNLKDLPPPEIIEHVIPPTPEQLRLAAALPDATGQLAMFTSDRLDLVQRVRLSQAAKGFVYDKGGGGSFRRVDSRKPRRVAALAGEEMRAGRQVLVWTVFDAESELVLEAMRGIGLTDGVAALTGKTKPALRPDLVERFRRGNIRCLVSRPAVLGYGMNFQFCRAMVFSGWTDSFEAFYQAVRRCYRYGQTERVRVHIPFIPELEGVVLENIRAKEARFLAEVERQERSYIKAIKDAK